MCFPSCLRSIFIKKTVFRAFIGRVTRVSIETLHQYVICIVCAVRKRFFEESTFFKKIFFKNMSFEGVKIIAKSQFCVFWVESAVSLQCQTGCESCIAY